MKITQLLPGWIFVGLIVFLGVSCSGPSNESEEREQITEEEVTDSSPEPSGLTQVWSTDPTLATPESALYYAAEEIIFVSNLGAGGGPTDVDGNGFISKVSLDGKVLQLKWATGMDSPKGMAIFGDKLFVADIQHVRAIDLADGSITSSWQLDSVIMFNDITVAPDGTIYISDSRGGGIYKMQGDDISLFLSPDKLREPNGVLAAGDFLYIGSVADSTLYKSDLLTHELTSVASGMGRTDGVEINEAGEFLVSDWRGRLFRVAQNGEVTLLLNTMGEKINTADIDYVQQKGWILVPTFYDNRLVAYKVSP